nr:hypothetical protein BaRGS_004328 [Batillaria attramentaria]
MMVLSQLQFRKYLDNQVDPITAAATRLLPRPATLGNPDGDFDVLIISRRSEWWERSVTDRGQDTNMTDDLYERLVARFCGPATSIEVPTVTTPRRCMELRTPSEAIAHTGLTMAILTLVPEQLELINRPGLEKLFLWGPPDNETDVETAVNDLAAAANNGELYIIADEAIYDGPYDDDNTSGRFSEFVTHLSNRVPSLHLWAAAVERVRVPSRVSVETLTRPLRCPPAVVREVKKAEKIDGQDLQYRDTIILCEEPRDDLPMVSRLRARGLPVQVVTRRDDEVAIRDLAVVRRRRARGLPVQSDSPRDVLYNRTGFVILTVFVVTSM